MIWGVGVDVLGCASTNKQRQMGYIFPIELLRESDKKNNNWSLAKSAMWKTPYSPSVVYRFLSLLGNKQSFPTYHISPKSNWTCHIIPNISHFTPI